MYLHYGAFSNGTGTAGSSMPATSNTSNASNANPLYQQLQSSQSVQQELQLQLLYQTQQCQMEQQALRQALMEQMPQHTHTLTTHQLPQHTLTVTPPNTVAALWGPELAAWEERLEKLLREHFTSPADGADDLNSGTTCVGGNVLSATDHPVEPPAIFGAVAANHRQHKSNGRPHLFDPLRTE